MLHEPRVAVRGALNSRGRHRERVPPDFKGIFVGEGALNGRGRYRERVRPASGAGNGNGTTGTVVDLALFDHEKLRDRC